jgi:hypothetical protein
MANIVESDVDISSGWVRSLRDGIIGAFIIMAKE